jgi:DNA-binding transcriptional LysR family regulator
MAYLDNIAVFVRVVELGNLSAAGRDMRISPAVASNRIKELEKHLGVRLFNRTTRQLMPTEHGTVFYTGAKQVLDAITEAEAAVSALSGQPRGTIKVTAPLGLGRRLIASGIPDFHDKYPDIEVRLRLSDHNVDIMKEGIDVAFRLGIIEDSSLRMRGIMECERVLVAAPKYLEARGEPIEPQELIGRKHDCLMLRYAGAREFVWTLQTPTGVQKYEVHGPYDTDGPRHHQQAALRGRAVHPRPQIADHPAQRAANAGAVRRRLSAQEAAGPEGTAAARFHGRTLPTADQGSAGRQVTARWPT